MKRRSFLAASAAMASTVAVPGFGLGAQPAAAAGGTGPGAAPAASNVFVEPAKPRLTVPDARPGDRIEVTVSVPGGDPVWSGSLTAAASGPTRITVPVGRGYYTATYQLTGASGTVTATDTFCVLGAIAATIPGLGVNTHFGFGPDPWDPTVLSPLIAAAGIATVRDTEEWWGAEPAKGSYDFSLYRQYRASLVANGLTDLPVLSFNNANYDGGATPYTDAGRAGFAQYAVELVRQNPQVAAVEIFNEFNIPTFGARGGSPANCQPDYYFLLLKATVTELRKHYPHLRYVAPATSGVPIDWLKAVFDQGGLDYVDAVSVHPYCYPAAPEQLAQQLQQVDALIRSYGVRRDLWISELGWTNATTQLSVDARTQAAYAVQSAATAYATGARDFFWYDFMDDGTDSGEQEQNFGMVRMVSGGSTRPKPVYAAYANLARQLTAAATPSGPAGLKNDAPAEGVTRTVIPGRPGATWMLWAADPTPFAVTVEGSAVFTDTYGAAVRVFAAPGSGTFSLTLGTEPVYLTSPRPLAVAGSVRHQLTAHEAKRGEDLAATWLVDNTGGDRPVTAKLLSGGRIVATAVAAPGATASTEVAFGTADAVGRRTVHASVTEQDTVVARLAAEYLVAEPLTLSVLHVLKDGQDALRVRVANSGSTDQGVPSLTWTIGSVHASASDLTIAAGAVDERFVSLTGLTTKTPYQVEATMDDGATLSAAGDVVVVAASDLRHIPRRTITVDGVNELAGSPRTGTSSEGTVVMTGYQGAQDLSFDFWLSHDADRLYLTVAATDDVHNGSAIGDQIWQNDSLQFAVGAGTPGEARTWNEIGASLVGGAASTWRWSGPSTGALPAGGAAVVRSGTTTTYEVGIAWSDLGIDPSGGLISFSMLVNDNDGQGRKGYIEWASGIGDSKDSALFKGFVLDA
ncbi:sugar-binding protein [Streptomyces sp. NPDC020917]|uniref:sugar-binding protein n=1 Tax=Streptomyces sp. NPDC020917 TaxID=3365102 RepID=UPI00378C84EA